MDNQVTLPWPPKELNPNKRTHWASKYRIGKRYRASCFWLAKGRLKVADKWARHGLELIFMPPDNRKRDDDNMIASFKAGRDGIADALGIDDNLLKLSHTVGESIKGGAVVAKIKPLPVPADKNH